MSRSIVVKSRAAFLSNPRRALAHSKTGIPSGILAVRPYSDNPETAMDDDLKLFDYTSGRYLFNESLRLEERHVRFDVDALKHAAERALDNQHGRVSSIIKMAEGGFNRVFLLQMEDGFEAVAKVPYRVATPDWFATASEVATLKFLRLKGIPVPEVLGHSTTHDNPVGTEYIIMQKAHGVSLASKWQELSTKQINRLAHSFIEAEKKLFDIPFGATGSIYFKTDLSPELQAPLYSHGNRGEGSDEFCIGPIADYMFWYGRRAGLRLERGPWETPVEYLRSIADKEIEWTRSFGKDREPDFPYSSLGFGQQSAASYIDLLEKYKELTPYLLPNSHDPLSQPTLRHPDLTPGNIFISPDTDRISCLIDWQHTVVQPRLLAAGYPAAFENPESEVPIELKAPSLPENIETFEPYVRAEAEEAYRRRAMFYYYRVYNGHFNKAHLAALNDPFLQLRQHLVDRAGRQWNGNLITLKGALIRTTQFWENLPGAEGIKCPVQFDKAEVDEFLKKEVEWLETSFVEENWRQQICFMTEEGWVRNEDFDEAKLKLKELTDLIWSKCEGDEEDEAWFRTGWPFRDHEEVD